MPERELDPTVYRRRLRNHLRQLRDAKGVTQATAATAMDWSVSKLIRIEAGQHTITVNDLKPLIEYYGVTDSKYYSELIEMAKNARQHSWLSSYRHVATEVFLTFAAYEENAVRSSSFQPVLMPGLLQTDEYAAEVLRVVRGSQDASRIARLIDLRLARQERLLARRVEIELNYILDESVVRRVVGGRQTMRRQILAVIEALERDDISLRILPFGIGMYRSMRVPFVVLEFSDPEDEAILYLEYPQGESLVREDSPLDASVAATDRSAPTAPPTYLGIFSELREQTSDEETRRILQRAMDDLDS